MDRARRIQMFVRVADAGSFAKAALSLDVTPSAVSHAIAELEKELRVALFYRTTRQLRLTEDGEAIYQRGRDIVDRLAELDNAVAGRAERLSGTLRVGLSAPLNTTIVMPALPIFLRRHPALRLDLLLVWQPKEMNAEGVDLLLSVVKHRLIPG
jgi:DNA-binding transcriptional LysR family regulator